MMNEKTFLQRALNSYDNPACISVDEFKQDLERFSHIKKIFNKYLDGSGLINERLVLNHLVICFNVFGQAAIDLAFFKMEERHYGLLLPYLIFLNRLPDNYLIVDKINPTDIHLDKNIVSKLREL